MLFSDLVNNMIAMNRMIAEAASAALETDDPQDNLRVMDFCDGFIRACDETQTNMRKIRNTLRGFDEPLPEGDVEDFEANVLASIAALP